MGPISNKHGAMGPWCYRAMGPWGHEAMGLWSHGALGLWGFGALGLRVFGQGYKGPGYGVRMAYGVFGYEVWNIRCLVPRLSTLRQNKLSNKSFKPDIIVVFLKNIKKFKPK
jgi:hypothetical protein